MSRWPIRRVLWPVIRPILRALLAALPVDDPWHKRASKVARHQFGPGNIHDWPWYFEGKSGVPVASLKDICSWLRTCEYVHDQILFQQVDFWQHPVTFETTKKGDCEDHALWAWRKLTELGIPSELVRGRCVSGSNPDRGAHAWVIFKRKDRPFILEATAKDPARMVLPSGKAWKHYAPEFSVDAGFKTYLHDGFIETIRLKLKRDDRAGKDAGRNEKTNA